MKTKGVKIMNYTINNTGTIEIETERLILRPVKLEDAQDLYQLVIDKDVLEFLAGLPQYTGIELLLIILKINLQKNIPTNLFMIGQFV